MSDKDKIAIKLKHQFDLIWESLKSLEYLINFPNYLKFTDNDKPKDLWFLYYVIRNNTVLNLNKLYNPTEDYSFDKTKRLLIKDFDKTDEKTKEILLRLKEGKKLFDKLNLKNIRDKHVGHLDENRTEKNLNWNEVKKLVLISCDIHDKMNLLVYNQQSAWIIDEKILNSIFTNDLRSKKLFELRRELFRENIITTSRDKILELTKKNWP
jgi:hypothetical protein